MKDTIENRKQEQTEREMTQEKPNHGDKINHSNEKNLQSTANPNPLENKNIDLNPPIPERILNHRIR